MSRMSFLKTILLREKKLVSHVNKNWFEIRRKFGSKDLQELIFLTCAIVERCYPQTFLQTLSRRLLFIYIYCIMHHSCKSSTVLMFDVAGQRLSVQFWSFVLKVLYILLLAFFQQILFVVQELRRLTFFAKLISAPQSL